MATTNPFDLLGGADVEDPTLFIAAQGQKLAAVATTVTKKTPATAAKKVPAADAAKSAKFPSKPQPPSQAGELSI